MVKERKKKIPARAAGDVLYIHVFSHTHWDFEWYEVQEGIKLPLVRLIDHLMDTLECCPAFKFHFDGQVMPIMDYLEILKEEDNCDNKNRVGEAERRISKFVTRGQLSIGPCWSTPETCLISCESLIRNINRGIRFSKKFGAVSSVFYNADAFQYHSQVPQIIKETGLKAAFTWRAYKAGKALKDLCIWEGADKTSVIKYYPPRSYAQIWQLPPTPLDALNILKREADFLRNSAVTKHVLITQGNDQIEAQSDVNVTVNKVNEIIGENYHVSHVTLEEFFKIIKNEEPELNIFQGELTGNKWACTLSGQLSARIYLKQKNKEAEISIEKWAEPFATFAWLLGAEYPAGLLERAWEYLMRQHFHHCNACAIDEVHREGEVRYKSAIELAKGVASESLKRISSKIDSSHIIDDKESALVIFNPSDVERTGVVNVEIDIDAHNDADWQGDKNEIRVQSILITDLALKDEQGEGIPSQILNGRNGACEIAFWAEKIPPFGYKTYGLGFPGGQPSHKHGNIGNKKRNILENDILKITIRENGSLTILDKRNGEVFNNQNILEDSADHGDTYNFDLLKGDKLITSKGAKGKITLKENGPFVATYQVKTELVLPECLAPDRKARSKKLVKLPVLFYITLKKGSPLIYITAEIDNQIKDHRLRVVFSGPKSDFVHIQTQGDVVKRRIEKYEEYPMSWRRDIAHSTSVGDLPKEKAPSLTQFQRNFAGINDGERGLFILNKGLPEYEARTDGTIALTLLRSVGWLSQDDLVSRDNLAGPKIEVPDAQCIRKHIFEYAILIQDGPLGSEVRYENQYSIPIKSLEIPWQEGRLPFHLSFVRIKPDAMMVAAIKKAYIDDNVIIRLFNPTKRRLKGTLSIWCGIKEAWLTDLNEEKREAIPVQSDGSIPIEAGPKKIITISLSSYSATDSHR